MAEQTFSDPLAQEFYRQGEMELESAESAEAVLRKAEAYGQKDARSEVMQSAFYFLAAAHFLETRDAGEAARAYHQAGQQLHRIGQFAQAGRAYSSAGRQAERAARRTNGASQHELQHLAVRSYSRANHCFAEVGELDWSEVEYLNERNARVAWAKMEGKHPWGQLAWKVTSNYGTSFSRWGLWVGGTVGVFSLLYELFFQLQWLQPMEAGVVVPAWIPFWSALYYSVNVTAALGLVDHQPTHVLSQAVVVINVLAGYLLLGIGIGIIGRMIRTR